jgi:AraC-like DNA-binding protein
MLQDGCSCFAATPMGRKRHAARTQLPRHCHREAFAAVVLKGGYVEAGDRGRMRVGAGDVILHGPYESHLDCFAADGADVLVLPFEGVCERSVGRVADPDALVRLAENDLADAASALLTQLASKAPVHDDWPDKLARDLSDGPAFALEDWAEEMGLCPESVSRGFRRVFGISPVSFRARTRTLKALSLIDGKGGALADIAAACGFSDQAHLSRDVRRLTGDTPRRLRRRKRA